MRFNQYVPAAWAAFALAGASVSFAMPPEQVANNIPYVTGGVTVEESSEMQAAAHQWPLSLEFAVQTAGRAQWMGSVDVHITDAKGQSVFDARSDGPLLMARLAPGSYTVTATAGGQTLQRKVQVTSGKSAKAVFMWPREKAAS